MMEQSSYLTNKIIPICEQIFKVTQHGLAFCYCCRELINLYDSVEAEFMKHFINDTSEKHKEFTKIYFKQNQSNNKKQLLANNEEVYMRDVTEEDRQAFCRWCNKTINVAASIGEEFILHFNDKFHEQFFNNLIKGEKNLNRKELFKQFEQIDSTKKYIQLKEKDKRNYLMTSIILLDAKKAEGWKRKQIIEEEMQVNSFLELIQKYFEFFISELIQIKCHFEAFCFIMAIIGKKDIEICELKFESLAEEIKILSPNDVLSSQLLKILQNSFLMFWEQIGFTKEGYLLEQPFQVQKLKELLDKVKHSLIIKTKDEEYKKFLTKIQIEELNNLSKYLQQRQLFQDQKNTEEKLIEEEINKGRN